jgi:hypothetical protein
VEGGERGYSLSFFAYRNGGAFDEACGREVIGVVPWGPGRDVSRHYWIRRWIEDRLVVRKILISIESKGRRCTSFSHVWYTLGHAKITVVAGFRGRVKAGEKKKGGWSLRSRATPLPHVCMFVPSPADRVWEIFVCFSSKEFRSTTAV